MFKKLATKIGVLVASLGLLLMAVTPAGATETPIAPQIGSAQTTQGVGVANLWCASWVHYEGSNQNMYTRIPTSAASKIQDCVLNSGHSGNGVRALQENLNGCYGKRLIVDGSFGPATRTALIQVQNAVGVVADGIFGPATRNAMVWNTRSSYGCKSINWVKSNMRVIYN